MKFRWNERCCVCFVGGVRSDLCAWSAFWSVRSLVSLGLCVSESERFKGSTMLLSTITAEDEKQHSRPGRRSVPNRTCDLHCSGLHVYSTVHPFFWGLTCL